MDKELIAHYMPLIGQLNKETRLHSMNVAQICSILAPHLNLNKDTAYKIGLLHDVGKVYIPSRILKKNKKLTEIEREVIDLHAYYGFRILKTYGEPAVIYVPVLFHHGIGKSKLRLIDEPLTDEILQFIFLVHSVDIYEAMTSRRVYHDPEKQEVVYKILSEENFCTEKIICELRKMNAEHLYNPILG